MIALIKSPFKKGASLFFCITLCFSLIANDGASREDDQDASVFESQDWVDDVDTQGISLLHEDTFDQQKMQGMVSDDDDEKYALPTTEQSIITGKIINDIIVTGNKLVSKEAILNYIPYAIGEPFDANKTGALIRNLFDNLKRFKDIKVLGQLVPDGRINLYIVVEEKPALKEIVFKGNSALSEKEIKKKINFDVPALDDAELKRYARKIQKLYRDKNYHEAVITPRLEVDENNTARAIFMIEENKKTLVNRIKFAGNNNITSKELRSILYTREDWVLGFLDGSGSFQPERLEADRHMIEQYYQNHGYLTAKVVDVDVDMNKQCHTFAVTFYIQEGDCYTVCDVSTEGNDILKEQYLLTMLPIKAGEKYSREKISESIKILEMIWGELGYIYAHIDPSIVPDDENKTVSVAFHVDLGSKVFLNKLNIIGNNKTRDKVIRRRLSLEDGCLITGRRMEDSKTRVEGLGYFDPRDGVNWKMRRINAEKADLDLILKEAKTGRAHIKMGFGGAANLTTPGSKFSLGVEIADTNLFGAGISATLEANLSKDEQNVFFNITDPWLFDKPLTGALDFYHKRPSYDEFRNINAVNEKLTGGSVTFGFVASRLAETQILFRGGFDSLAYEKPPQSQIRDPLQPNLVIEHQRLLDKLFKREDFFWYSTHFLQDFRNNPMHPSRGIRWNLISKFGIPTFNYNVGFHKLDFDFHWYTPLIGEYDLVLHIHTFLGIITRFKNDNIPYRELYHIGGPASVRGFNFGDLSPQFRRDSIGGTKALFVNTELIFPIAPDFSMKGLVFYDGGTGWHAPYADDISPLNLYNNSFNYRHAVGFGVRLLKPAPIRIDWGFKLDRKKKLHEQPYEVHFSMSYDW